MAAMTQAGCNLELTYEQAAPDQGRNMICTTSLLPTALAREVMQSPPSVCFHSFKPNDLWPYSPACVRLAGIDTEGQRQDKVSLTSILDRGQFSGYYCKCTACCSGTVHT